MNDYIDDIVCDLLDTEPIADPTQAIENLTSLHNVFEKYGEQPELVKLTGLTKDAVVEYLDKADASLEGFMNKILSTIKKSYSAVAGFVFSKNLKLAKQKLKTNTTYTAMGFGVDENGKFKYTLAADIFNIEDPVSNDQLMRKDPTFQEKYKKTLESYKEKFTCREMTFETIDFESIVRLAETAEKFFKEGLETRIPKMVEKWDTKEQDPDAVDKLKQYKAFHPNVKEYISAMQFAQKQCAKMFASVISAVNKNKTKKD